MFWRRENVFLRECHSSPVECRLEGNYDSSELGTYLLLNFTFILSFRRYCEAGTSAKALLGSVKGPTTSNLNTFYTFHYQILIWVFFLSYHWRLLRWQWPKFSSHIMLRPILNFCLGYICVGTHPTRNYPCFLFWHLQYLKQYKRIRFHEDILQDTWTSKNT